MADIKNDLYFGTIIFKKNFLTSWVTIQRKLKITNNKFEIRICLKAQINFFFNHFQVY